MNSRNNIKKELFEIAQIQQGFFTAKQAIEAGYKDNIHTYHVRAGNWTRETRGVYRLANYPSTEESQLVKWHLWAMNRDGEPQGVYSHETALSLFNLSDIMPAKLSMTVGKSFRRMAKIPEILIIRKGDIEKKDIEEREGYRVTKPFKTIEDLLSGKKTESKIIKQALMEGYKQGHINRFQVNILKEKYWHYGSQGEFLKEFNV